MKNTIKNIKWFSFSVLLGLLLGGGMATVSAWTNAPSNPPSGNVGAPVNVSNTSQVKSGPLQVNGFRNIGSTVLDGNVGIGTTSPSQRLEVVNGNARIGDFGIGNNNYGNVPGPAIMADTNLGRINIKSINGVHIVNKDTSGYVNITAKDFCTDSGKCLSSIGGGGGGGIAGSGTAGYIPKWTAGTSLGNSVMQEKDGKIGIGQVPGVDSSILQVGGNVIATSGYICNDSNGASAGGSCLTNSSTGGVAVSLIGNLILSGASDTAYTIPMAEGMGGNKISFSWTGSELRAKVDGDVFRLTTTNVSDIRYKKNIEELNDSLNNVLKLRGVKYDWRVDEFPNRGFTNDKQIGVIAQEIEKIYPELVQTDEKGYKSVLYEKLTPILIEAIKEQQKQIDSQKNSNFNQQQQIDALRKDIELLKLQK